MRAKHILSRMPLNDFFQLNKNTLKSITGFSLSFLNKLNFKDALNSAEIEVNLLNKNNVSFSFYENDSYPNRLKNCPDPPLVLYHYGNGSLSPKKTVAIVGSRNASTTGKKITKNLVNELSNQNITIVSGLAYGIDICAHTNSLENNNETIAILANGFDFIYPYCHKNIANKIANKGLLISEHSLGISPQKSFFPRRNRIIAGISDATIVVESNKKGGAMITARMANDYNRDVFAFPGEVENPHKAGCNKLIQENKAHLITSCSDFLRFMNWDNNLIKKETKKKTEKLNNMEERVFKIISKNDGPIEINNIKIISGLSIKEIQTILFSLEFKGLINPGAGQTFWT